MLSYNDEIKSHTFERHNLPTERLVIPTEIKVFYVEERIISKRTNSSILAVCTFLSQLKTYCKKFTHLIQFLKIQIILGTVTWQVYYFSTMCRANNFLASFRHISYFATKENILLDCSSFCKA